MFLAGNAPSAAYNVAQPRHHLVAPSPKPVAEDIGFRGQLVNTPPCSALSSPISVSSHPTRQSVGGSTNNDGPTKVDGGSSTPVNGTPKVVTSAGHVAATTMMQSGTQILQCVLALAQSICSVVCPCCHYVQNFS